MEATELGPRLPASADEPIVVVAAVVELPVSFLRGIHTANVIDVS
jgi:hypothetical protein